MHRGSLLLFIYLFRVTCVREIYLLYIYQETSESCPVNIRNYYATFFFIISQKSRRSCFTSNN